MKLAELLVEHGLIHAQALSDPEGFDGGDTLARVHAVEKELEGRLVASHQAICLASDKIKMLTEALQSISHMHDPPNPEYRQCDCRVCNVSKLALAGVKDSP